MKSLSTAQWHLILYEEGKVELFRTDQDVQEAQNLANTAEGHEVIKVLGQHLTALMTPQDWATFGPLITVPTMQTEKQP